MLWLTLAGISPASVSVGTIATLHKANLIRCRKPLLSVSSVCEFGAAALQVVYFIVLLHNNKYKGWQGVAYNVSGLQQC